MSALSTCTASLMEKENLRAPLFHKRTLDGRINKHDLMHRITASIGLYHVVKKRFKKQSFVAATIRFLLLACRREAPFHYILSKRVRITRAGTARLPPPQGSRTFLQPTYPSHGLHHPFTTRSSHLITIPASSSSGTPMTQHDPSKHTTSAHTVVVKCGR